MDAWETVVRIVGAVHQIYQPVKNPCAYKRRPLYRRLEQEKDNVTRDESNTLGQQCSIIYISVSGTEQKQHNNDKRVPYQIRYNEYRYKRNCRVKIRR